MPRVQIISLCALLGLACCVSPVQSQSVSGPAAEVASAVETHASAAELRLRDEFSTKLFPLLSDAESGCVDCHSAESTSALVLSGNASSDFWQLLDGGYLAAKGPDTILGRVSSEHPQRRMPKDGPAWSEAELSRLRAFLSDVAEMEQSSGVRADEHFPRSLLSPFHGTYKPPAENQFLTYRQLRGKIGVIFADEWQRGDRDYFAENIALFGGADFENRFNESTTPSSSFLTGLEMLARDVAQRAYQRRTGPFANWREPAADPRSTNDGKSTLDEDYRQAIAHLYQAILFRQPTPAELSSSYELLVGVHQLHEQISKRDSELVFELTVTDKETGLSRTRNIAIPVRGDRTAVQQWIVDQRGADRETGKIHDILFRPLISQVFKQALASDDSSRQRLILGEPVMLTTNGAGQRVVVHNSGTFRNVSFAGIEILDSKGTRVQSVDADSGLVQVEGAWKLENDDGFASFEDGNQHKGLSTISVPLEVDADGHYYVAVLWRGSELNANNVLVELFAGDDASQLASPQTAVIPPRGEAHFTYDCSVDNVPYIEFDNAFIFAADSYVEISNENTLETVTAGAVELVSRSNPDESILIDSVDAEGQADWQRFDEGRFKAYNVKGKKLHDDNKDKGKLALRYRLPPPSSDAEAATATETDADVASAGEVQKVGDALRPTAYDVRIYYPGKRDQEPLVPVVIRAASSAPIVQVTHPVVAKADARICLDASASYTIQGSELQFAWRQVSGPLVELNDPHAAKLKFDAPRLRTRQVAWSSLCGALLRHPDFIFTRAPSVAWASPQDRQRLTLGRLALDLLGRCPTNDELEELAGGKPLHDFVDQYLDSDEFRDFYFHRIRLYLESQGGAVQDEPARLWSYVAFEDRPFQEILTADYTVNEDFERVERPAHHGRTGVLTAKGFIDGKPGLPHYNYAAQVSMLFLGYVYEVPPEIVEQREGVTALGTTDPNSNCYSCHKILTPLAFQRLNWTDLGEYRTVDDDGLKIDASDRMAAEDYPFAGDGLEAFATQAVKKERFTRTMINTHVAFYFGRPLRVREDEREFYKRLWDHTHSHDFKLRELIRAIVTSEEYLSLPVSNDRQELDGVASR